MEQPLNQPSFQPMSQGNIYFYDYYFHKEGVYIGVLYILPKSTEKALMIKTQIHDGGPAEPRASQASIFLGVASFQGLVMFRRGLFYAYLSIYLRYHLGLSVTETTLFATLPMLLNIASQTFIWGRLSDQRQIRRTLIIWGELAGGIGTILVWWAHVLAATPVQAGYVIIIGLSLVEIVWSMSNLGWSALISDLYPQRKRNEIMGYLTSLGGVGRFAGIWIGGLLYDGFGMRFEGWGFESGVLFFTSVAAMLFSMVPLFFVPEGGARKTEWVEPSCDTACQKTSLRLYVIFLAAMTLINFGRNCVMVIQSQYLFLDTGFNVSSRVLSYIFNMESIAIILFGLLAGIIGRAFGNGRAVCIGTAAALVYLVLFIISDDLWMIYVAAFFRGAAEVIILAASYAMASFLIPPQHRGRLFGYFNATLFLSWGVAGTLIAGPVVDLLQMAGTSDVIAYKGAYGAALVMTSIGLALQMFLVFVLIPRAGVDTGG